MLPAGVEAVEAACVSTPAPPEVTAEDGGRLEALREGGRPEAGLLPVLRGGGVRVDTALGC